MCTVILVVVGQGKTGQIENIQSDLEAAILSLQEERPVEVPPAPYQRFRDTYVYKPTRQATLRQAQAECLISSGRLLQTTPDVNPEEVFKFFNTTLVKTWIQGRLDDLSRTVLNQQGSILLLAGSEYVVEWKTKPTKPNQCVALIPPDDQPNVFSYTQTPCGTPLTYFCQKPIPERNTDQAIRERKEIISDIVNSLTISKEKLQLTKTVIDDLDDLPDPLNEITTYVNQIQQELTETEINTGVLSQKSKVIQDSIDATIGKITKDFVVKTRQITGEIRLQTRTNEDKINSIAIKNNNQNAIIAKKVEVDQLIAVHKDIISVKTELKRCNTEIATIKQKNDQQDSEINQVNSVIQDYFETDKQIEQSEEEHSEQFNITEDNNHNNQTEQEIFIDDDDQSEENGSGITYSNTTVPPPQTTPVTDEPNKDPINEITRARVQSPKRIGQSQLVRKINSIVDRIAHVEQYISKNTTQKLIKNLKKLEKRIDDCCNTHFKWFSEVISTLAVILSIASLTVQVYVINKNRKENSETNTRVYFQVRRN